MSRVLVDGDVCVGHARCAAAAPGVFSLDEDGRTEVRDRALAPYEVEGARTAARWCPEQAITVVDG